MPDDRARRHRKIQDLVERDGPASQEELGRALAAAGLPVAQSTLSRDLRDLGIVRTRTRNGFRYVQARRLESGPPGPLADAAAREVRSVACNEVAVVVRTRDGHAQAVAVELDRMALKRVLGTVAGDDTILVIPRSARGTRALRRELASLFGTD